MAKQEEAAGLRVETKIHHNFGEPVGQTETQYDERDRVVFQRMENFSTGSMNEVRYVREGDVLREEIWTDKEGRICRYKYVNDPRVLEKRELVEKDPDFEDADF
jgi:hypothetical protein